ncbi:serine hydrolase family protein [Candidatus Kaiserbacteria bacterium]|nr:serine hydrolase family protein [Candidatus Kaiserbacteria bacterium]
MKKRIIIVHGWEGSPTSDWIGWATEAFREKGYEVVAPLMPDTDNPVIEKWVEHLKSVVGVVDKDTYFIGHSIGCQTIMRFAQTIDTKVGGAIFVAGWFNLTNLENKEAEDIARPWLQAAIDYEKVKMNLGKSVAILSDNDPFVPYEETKKDFETRLGSEVVTVHGAGHMSSDDDFGPFPQLIEIFESHFK